MLIKDPSFHCYVFCRVPVICPRKEAFADTGNLTQLLKLIIYFSLGDSFHSVLLKTAVTDAFKKYLDFMLILMLLQSFFYISAHKMMFV